MTSRIDPAAAQARGRGIPGLSARRRRPGLPRALGGARLRDDARRCIERGLFTWPEWAAALAEEIKRAQQAGDPDTGETYYRHWLAALEKMVAQKGVASARHAGALSRRLGSRRRPHAARQADRATRRAISATNVLTSSAAGIWRMRVTPRPAQSET